MLRAPLSSDHVATIGTAVLGGVLLGRALGSPEPAYTLGAAAAGLIAGVAAMTMAARDSFDARLVAGLVCATTGLLSLLALLVGTPGGSRADLTLATATLLACGILVPVLLGSRSSVRPAQLLGERPYAP